MPKMFWFGLLLLASLLLSHTAFAESDAEGDRNADANPEDQGDPEQKVVILKKQHVVIPIEVHEGEVLEHFPESPEIIFEDVPREQIVEDQLQMDHKQNHAEAVEHMEQVAKDSRHDLPEPVVENIQEVVAGDQDKDGVVEGEYIGRRDPEAEEIFNKIEENTEIKKDEADEGKKKGISNVELLRRSDRSQAETGENKTKNKRRVYLRVEKPEQDLEFHEVHELNEKKPVHEVVFINTDSHAHVVLKNTDYPRLVRKHDEM